MERNYCLHGTITLFSALNKATGQLVGRGYPSHRNVPKELEESIGRWMEAWNENPRPYVWTKKADRILGNIQNLCQRTSATGH